MCNFNRVYRGTQRYHYSCCRRRMHQIVATPCCSSGQNTTTEESIEMCWPRTCPAINGTAKNPAVEKTSTGDQLPRISPKIPDPSKTNPLPEKTSRTANQKTSNNKSSDNSISPINKKLSKGSPVQANLSHKVSVKKSVKMARLSGGVELNKNRMPCICSSCEEDSLMSVCSSVPDYASMSIPSAKTTRQWKKMNPCWSKLGSQDTDLTAIVRTKPKRKRILHRRWPSRSPECPSLESTTNTEQSNDDNGVWFECNLPFRVNIPFPISLFRLGSFPNNVCQDRSIVPASNNALPAPVPEPQPQPQPQPATTKKRFKRLKTRPGPCRCRCSCACETATQTGVEESDLLRCLYEIKNQLAAKSTECRCVAEKSTYVRALQNLKKAREGAKKLQGKPKKILKEAAAPSVVHRNLPNSFLREVQTLQIRTKITEKKPKKTQSCSSTNVSRNFSKCSLNEVPKRHTKTKKTIKKTQSCSSTNVSRKFSKCSLNEVPKRHTKTKKTIKKTQSCSSTNVSRNFPKCSINEVPKRHTKTKQTLKKSTKTQSCSSTNVSRNTSKSSLKDVPRRHTKIKKTIKNTTKTHPCSSTNVSRNSSKSSLNDVPKRHTKTKKTTKTQSCSTIVSRKSSKSSLNDVPKRHTKTKKTIKKTTKTQSCSSTNVSRKSSKNSLNDVPKRHTKTKKTIKKTTKTQPCSSTNVSRNSSKSSLNDVPKRQTKTKKTEKKPKETQSCLSTTVFRNSSKSSVNEVQKPSTKTKKAGRKPKEPVSVSAKTCSSCCCSANEVQKPSISTNKLGEKPKKSTSTSPRTSVLKIYCTRSVQEVENNSQKKLKEKNSIIAKSIEDKDMAEKHVSSDSKSKVVEKQIEPQVEEKKSKQIRKERECIDLHSPIACAAPRVFPNECGMCQGLENQSCCMYHGYNAGTPGMYQTPQYPGQSYQQSWPNLQRNAYLPHNTPQTGGSYLSPCSPTATCVGSVPCRPLVEVQTCEKIEAVKKPSVGFCHRAQVFSECTSPMKNESQCQSSCTCQRRSSGHCSQSCGQNWTIPISSSTEYNRKTLLKRALCKNASPMDCLSTRFPMAHPLTPGVPCKRTKSICFRVCPSQTVAEKQCESNVQTIAEKQCESNEQPKVSSCRRSHQELSCDRISSGGETNGVEGSQLGNVSRGIKSVSGSTLKYKIEQEYYFPLTDQSQRSHRSLNFQQKSRDCQLFGVLRNKTANMIRSQVDRSVNQRQSNASKGSGKKREECSSRKPRSQPKVKDNMSYNQNKSRDDKSEDQIIVNFTNRSFSIDSEELDRSASEEKQRMAQKPSEGIRTDEDFASQYSEKIFSRDHSLSESIRTDEEDDIDETPSTSAKTVQNFESRLIYSKFNRQYPAKRSDLYQISENLNNILSNNGETFSKHRLIPCTREVSGMSMRSSSSEKQVKKQQKKKINKNECSCSTLESSSVSAIRDGKSRSATPVMYRQSFSPRNQKREKVLPLTHRSNNVQDESSESELEHTKHIPSERIRKNDNRKDKNICKIPNYTLKVSIMQPKMRNGAKCVISNKQQDRTHTAPRYVPEYQNKQPKSPRNVEYPNADYKDSRQNPSMKNKNPINDCQPKECFSTDTSSDELQRKSDESHQVPGNRGQPRGPPFQERSPSPSRQNKRNPRMPSPHNKDIPKSRLRKPNSEEEYFHGYYSRPRKSTSPSLSSHSYASKSSISVERTRKSSSISSYNIQAKEKPKTYSENRNKSRYIHGKNSQISSSESEFMKRNSDSESAEVSLPASKEETEDSRSVVCKQSRKFVQSGRTKDVETVMQPRRLICNESTTAWNPDMGSENTVLLEIRTTCKKDNLLQTCARPPCHFSPDHTTEIPPTNVPKQSKQPNLRPQNLNSFKESYLIDPRNNWNTMRSPARAPAPSCQQQFRVQVDPSHPGYHPQQVKEAIKNLPVGFYDRTIRHYNVIRMQSDFQVPAFGAEAIHAVQAYPQSHCGYPACPYGNPNQPPMIRPVQDFSRPFFLPRNQIQHRLPMGPTPFYHRHSKYQC